jgi:hypothetical protein
LPLCIVYFVVNYAALDYIRSLFESVGLDHFINGSFNRGTFYTFFGEFTRRKKLDNIDTKSSLHLYKTFNITGRTQKYLININDFRGSRLKLVAGTNCLPVNSTLCRMQIRTNPQCTIINFKLLFISNMFHQQICFFFFFFFHVMLWKERFDNTKGVT